MDLTKIKKFLKDDDNYVHCSICGNYRNINSFAHRKSKDHQKKLASKLRKIAFHLSQKKKKEIEIHDEQWQEKDCSRFCHFCGQEYKEHHQDEEFIVKNLGALYHHSSSQHAECVKAFLKRNFREEKFEKYLIQEKDLNGVLEKVSQAKQKYLKKMEILNYEILTQVKESEETRNTFIQEVQAQSSTSSFSPQILTQEHRSNVNHSTAVCKSIKFKSDIKVPPWLEDVPDDTVTSGSSASAPVIGPTIETLMKHVANQKKKGLSKNRVGANFKHKIQGSTKWLPSFQSVWNKGRRKQVQYQFKRKNPTFKF